MKKAIILMSALILVFGFSIAQQKGKAVTIVGEVVETQCYVSGLTGPGKGPSHKECALKSAKQGIPLSILDEKTGMVYLAGQSKKAQSGANDLLIPFVAEKVLVNGRVFEKGGMKLLLIGKVEKYGTDEKKELKKDEKKEEKNK
jgi:hypothetical protein